jgi:hypothetical protein
VEPILKKKIKWLRGIGQALYLVNISRVWGERIPIDVYTYKKSKRQKR